MKLVALLIILVIPCAGQVWEKTQQVDTLTGNSYLQFRLEGKFLTPPRNGVSDKPTLVAKCQPGKHLRIYNGKVIDLLVDVGTVLDQETRLFKYRLDDGKIHDETWTLSTDGKAAFLPSLMLDSFLYGHELPHKEGTTNPPIRKAVVSLNEYLAGQVVMQFDMPNPAEIQEACGVIAHKR